MNEIICHCNTMLRKIDTSHMAGDGDFLFLDSGITISTFVVDKKTG